MASAPETSAGWIVARASGGWQALGSRTDNSFVLEPAAPNHRFAGQTITPHRVCPDESIATTNATALNAGLASHSAGDIAIAPDAAHLAIPTAPGRSSAGIGLATLSIDCDREQGAPAGLARHQPLRHCLRRRRYERDVSIGCRRQNSEEPLCTSPA